MTVHNPESDVLQSASFRQGTEKTDARTAEGRFHAARDTAREYLERGKERAIAMEEGLESYIQDHPVRSILIAGGVGIVIGALLFRR